MYELDRNSFRDDSFLNFHNLYDNIIQEYSYVG